MKRSVLKIFMEERRGNQEKRGDERILTYGDEYSEERKRE